MSHQVKRPFLRHGVVLTVGAPVRVNPWDARALERAGCIEKAGSKALDSDSEVTSVRPARRTPTPRRRGG